MTYGEHLKSNKHFQNHIDAVLTILKIRQSVVLNYLSQISFEILIFRKLNL